MRKRHVVKLVYEVWDMEGGHTSADQPDHYEEALLIACDGNKIEGETGPELKRMVDSFIAKVRNAVDQ